MSLEPDIFSWLMIAIVTAASFVAYFPQAVRLIRTKSSDDISVLSWSIWLGQYLIMLSYAIIYTSDIVLCLAYGIEAAACFYIIFLTLKYRRVKKTTSKETDCIEVPEGLEWFPEYFKNFTEQVAAGPKVTYEEAMKLMRSDSCERKLSDYYSDLAEYEL